MNTGGSWDWIGSILFSLQVVSNFVLGGLGGLLGMIFSDIRNDRKLDRLRRELEKLQVLFSVSVPHADAEAAGTPIPFWDYVGKCVLISFLVPLELLFVAIIGFLIVLAALSFNMSSDSLIYFFPAMLFGTLLYSIDKRRRKTIREVSGVRLVQFRHPGAER